MFETQDQEYSDEERRQWRANERHGKILAHRFSSLVLHGYRPVVHCELDCFDFEHPHKQAIQVQLWADGKLVDRYPSSVRDGYRTIINPSDQQLFSRFLESVPKPTELQKLMATPMSELLMTALAWILMLTLLSITWAITKTLWHFLTGP
ncbi:hypothetical protein [Caulobacter sp. BP25]|uniref:hypothetical protein n=1 Tax=Caulobacter sp. BP25 TaxID=2048900 RepID=UPI000C12E163|nr:hypothetical protein [Caulobacter sp. BP25]PHY17557.1 hypothetical protein CSW59_18285 [Caulobacter sp. BP25]